MKMNGKEIFAFQAYEVEPRTAAQGQGNRTVLAAIPFKWHTLLLGFPRILPFFHRKYPQFSSMEKPFPTPAAHKKSILPIFALLHKFPPHTGPFGRLRRHLSVEKSYGLVPPDDHHHHHPQQDPFTSQRFAPPRRYGGSSDHLPGMMLAMGAPSMLPSYQQPFGMHYGGTEGRQCPIKHMNCNTPPTANQSFESLANPKS